MLKIIIAFLLLIQPIFPATYVFDNIQQQYFEYVSTPPQTIITLKQYNPNKVQPTSMTITGYMGAQPLAKTYTALEGEWNISNRYTYVSLTPAEFTNISRVNVSSYGDYIYSGSVSQVPELRFPALFGLGVLIILLTRRRK